MSRGARRRQGAGAWRVSVLWGRSRDHPSLKTGRRGGSSARNLFFCFCFIGKEIYLSTEIFFYVKKIVFFRGNTLMRFCMFTRRISLAGLEKQIQIIIIINGSMNFWSLFVGVITASCAGAVISPPQPTTLGTHHHFFQDAFCYVSLFKKPDRSGRGRERGHSCHSLPSECWQTPVNIRGVFCVPLLPRVRESPTRQKPRLLNKKKKESSDFLPSFCEIPLHL